MQKNWPVQSCHAPVAGLGELRKVLHDGVRGAGFEDHAAQWAAEARLAKRLPFRAPALVHDLRRAGAAPQVVQNERKTRDLRTQNDCSKEEEGSERKQSLFVLLGHLRPQSTFHFSTSPLPHHVNAYHHMCASMRSHRVQALLV